MITGTTRLVGIIGQPVSHSRSPLMHNTAFNTLGLDYAYVPLPVQHSQLAAAVTGLKALGFVGANVTIPHKVAIMQHLDVLDASAVQVGAVNTIVIRDGQAIGYNTDAAGFIVSLTQAGIKPAGKQAIILGAGGAARAVIAGLLQHSIASITVLARNEQKLTAFLKEVNDERVRGEIWRESIPASLLQTCDILINSTPIGMQGHAQSEISMDWQALRTTAAVCDLIYIPRLTPLLVRASREGHTVINGLRMLIEQGGLAFTLWTGQPAPRDIFEKIL